VPYAPLVVLDTMVVVAGVIGRTEGASAVVIREVATGGVRLAISDDFLRELVRVIGYPNVEDRIGRPVRAFEVALDLGTMGIMHHPRRFDWPSLRDPGDGWIFDLAYEAGVDYVVTNDDAVTDTAAELGFEAATPPELLEVLRAPPH
jgi:putative PIN family toxin of toxin-antitoxin system